MQPALALDRVVVARHGRDLVVPSASIGERMAAGIATMSIPAVAAFAATAAGIATLIGRCRRALYRARYRPERHYMRGTAGRRATTPATSSRGAGAH
jgi:hypothetical protein